MNKRRAPMQFHEEQRVIHKAAVEALRVDSGIPKPLLDKMEELSKELFDAADYDFKYGEPEQANKRIATMNTFMELLNEIMAFNNSKKGR